jgi:hypothetical protein
MRYTGMRSDWGGSRFAAVNNPSRARLNLKENRATTKAMQHERKSVSSTAGTVMMAEFSMVREKFACSQASL